MMTFFSSPEAYGCNECGRHIYHKPWVQPSGCERIACGKTGILRNHPVDGSEQMCDAAQPFPQANTPISLTLRYRNVFQKLSVFLVAGELPYLSRGLTGCTRRRTNANAVPGSSLWAPHSVEIAWVHSGRSTDARLGHWGEHRDLQHRKRGFTAPAPLCQSRTIDFDRRVRRAQCSGDSQRERFLSQLC